MLSRERHLLLLVVLKIILACLVFACVASFVGIIATLIVSKTKHCNVNDAGRQLDDAEQQVNRPRAARSAFSYVNISNDNFLSQNDISKMLAQLESFDIKPINDIKKILSFIEKSYSNKNVDFKNYFLRYQCLKRIVNVYLLMSFASEVFVDRFSTNDKHFPLKSTANISTRIDLSNLCVYLTIMAKQVELIVHFIQSFPLLTNVNVKNHITDESFFNRLIYNRVLDDNVKYLLTIKHLNPFGCEKFPALLSSNNTIFIKRSSLNNNNKCSFLQDKTKTFYDAVNSLADGKSYHVRYTEESLLPVKSNVTVMFLGLTKNAFQTLQLEKNTFKSVVPLDGILYSFFSSFCYFSIYNDAKVAFENMMSWLNRFVNNMAAKLQESNAPRLTKLAVDDIILLSDVLENNIKRCIRFQSRYQEFILSKLF